MKLNNYGWGMKEFIIAISAFAFCMIIVIILCNSLINSNKDLDISTELKGSSESSIKTYIGIEDKMVVSAKKYKIDETYISRSKKHIPYINKNLFNFPDEHLKDDYLKVVQDFVSAFSSENL